MKMIRAFDDDTIMEIFGHEAAEDDDIERLKKFYFKNAAYSRLRANNPLRLLIGHKGIGKSAMLAVAAREDTAQHKLSILLRPDDIDEIDIENVAMNAQIRAWKDGFLRIIGEKIFESFSIKKYFNQCEHASTWAAIAGDFGRIVTSMLDKNGIKLESSKQAVLEQFCAGNVIRIYIDDLDRGWTATSSSVMRMSAMLNAVRDITRMHKNIHFIISLRSDVFYLVRTSDESTDKLESACIWFSWTNHEILAMLVKRVKTYFGLPCPTDEALVQMDQHQLAIDLGRIMTDRFHGRGLWADVPIHRILTTLIRRRPRDLVKLCTLAARHAYENDRNSIDTQDFDMVFDRYSQDRLQDTVNEYKSELPNIQELLENMKPSQYQRKNARKNCGVHKFMFSTADIIKKIDTICQGHHFKFYGTRVNADAKDIVHFLYKIGFITARKEIESGKIIRHYFEEQNYVSSRYADYGCAWEIHPAYRWALSPYDKAVTDEIEILESSAE